MHQYRSWIMRHESACDAFLIGYLAGMRREGLPIRRRERAEYAPRLASVYDAGARAGRRL